MPLKTNHFKHPSTPGGYRSQVHIRCYPGYGDGNRMRIYGHLIQGRPPGPVQVRTGIWKNTRSLVDLYRIKPIAGVRLILPWDDQEVETYTEEDGFFKFEWTSPRQVNPGIVSVIIRLVDGIRPPLEAEGKLLIPNPGPFAFISDIDDTFLISHANQVYRKLYLLATKNPLRRHPVDGAAKHYRLLASNARDPDQPNPFFYVSSSEWNLFDYLQAFCHNHQFPNGVFLLNQIVFWKEMLQIGQRGHGGKFFRIACILKEFPQRQFVLLGDDSQQDPEIYTALAESFPDQIKTIYWRQVNTARRTWVEELAHRVENAGIPVCYFYHSREAIAHSRQWGLLH